MVGFWGQDINRTLQYTEGEDVTFQGGVSIGDAPLMISGSASYSLTNATTVGSTFTAVAHSNERVALQAIVQREVFFYTRTYHRSNGSVANVSSPTTAQIIYTGLFNAITYPRERASIDPDSERRGIFEDETPDARHTGGGATAAGPDPVSWPV
jgi:hypothetical protein